MVLATAGSCRSRRATDQGLDLESRYGSKQQVEEQTYGIGVWFWVWKEATGGGELRIWVR